MRGGTRHTRHLPNEGLFERGRSSVAVFPRGALVAAGTSRRWPTYAVTECSPGSTCTRPAARACAGTGFQKELFDNGLHLKTTGDCAIVAPPLIAEKQHIDMIVDILRKTLTAI